MLNNRVAGNDEVSCQRIVNVVNVANSKAVHVEPVHKGRGRSLNHPNVHQSIPFRLEKDGREITVQAKRPDGAVREFKATVRIDTPQEINYYKHGGILQYVLRQLLAQK